MFHRSKACLNDLKRNPMYLIGPVLVLTAAWASIAAIRPYGGQDFYHYWVVPRLAGQYTNIYDPQVRTAEGRRMAKQVVEQDPRAKPWGKVLCLTGTPMQYTVMSILAHGQLVNDYRRYQLVAIICWLGAMVLWCLWLQMRFWPACWLLGWMVFRFVPLRADLRVGNLGSLLLLGLTLYLLMQYRRRLVLNLAAGAWLGLLAMFKPSVAPVILCMAVVYLVDREYRRLAAQGSGLILGILGGWLMSCWYFNSWRIWIDWLVNLPAMLETQHFAHAPNTSIASWLYVTVGLDLSVPLTGVLLISACGMLAFQHMSPRQTVDSDASGCSSEWLTVDSASHRRRAMLAVMFGALTPIIAGPIVWTHYAVVLSPLLLMAFEPIPTHRPIDWRFLLRTVLGVVMLLVMTESLGPYLLPNMSDGMLRLVRYQLFTGGALIVGLLMLGHVHSASESGSVDGADTD